MSAVHPNYEVGSLDVSYHQGDIQWAQTAALVQFIIIRAGDGIHQGSLDTCFALVHFSTV